jgi:hypothetical protein
MLKKIDLFPQTIFKTEYKGELIPLINQLYNIKSFKPNMISYFPKELTYQTSFSLFKEYPIFNHLENFIKNILSTYMGPNFTIINSWGNIYPKYGYSSYHSHRTSTLSGVLYLKTPPNDSLCFFNKYDGNETFSVDLKDRDLLIFKGNQFHSTKPNLSDSDKIIIAFNAMFSN